jgi:hypothetical protein
MVSANTDSELSKFVSDALAHGWKLYGDPFFARLYSLETHPAGKDQFFQAVTREP